MPSGNTYSTPIVILDATTDFTFLSRPEKNYARNGHFQKKDENWIPTMYVWMCTVCSSFRSSGLKVYTNASHVSIYHFPSSEKNQTNKAEESFITRLRVMHRSERPRKYYVQKADSRTYMTFSDMTNIVREANTFDRNNVMRRIVDKLSWPLGLSKPTIFLFPSASKLSSQSFLLFLSYLFNGI